MKNLLIFIASLLLLTSCNNTIGNYTKEPLPEGLNYSITESLTNQNNNRVTISLNKQITIGQIATIADEIYDKYPTRNHFYIYYNIPESSEVWATSHFEPELTILILGINPN